MGDRAICALLVEFHMQRLGYIRPLFYLLYLYVFDAGLNRPEFLPGLSLSQRLSHQFAFSSHYILLYKMIVLGAHSMRPTANVIDLRIVYLVIFASVSHRIYQKA